MMWICLGLLMIGSVTAQVPAFGKCPTVEVMSNFDAQKYLGKWYETEKYFAIFEAGGKCITATYSANANGTVGVVNRQISSSNGKASSIEGYATQDDQEKAKLSVVFPSLPVKIAAPYWVLDTDYNNYSVVWSCSDITVAKARIVWILTRAQKPSADVLQKAYAVLDKNNIDRSLLNKTDQNNCPADA